MCIKHTFFARVILYNGLTRVITLTSRSRDNKSKNVRLRNKMTASGVRSNLNNGWQTPLSFFFFLRVKCIDLNINERTNTTRLVLLRCSSEGQMSFNTVRRAHHGSKTMRETRINTYHIVRAYVRTRRARRLDKRLRTFLENYQRSVTKTWFIHVDELCGDQVLTCISTRHCQSPTDNDL